ncbi:MAG: PEGA domain-containing protein, partial [Candidatus Paceibacterota bacterium]
MTKKTRTILFFFLMIFFVAAATGAIFYSQGYRFDLKNLKMLKTGGISIKASPINARVFLNQKLAGTTMPMADYVFVQGLLPKTYEVKVEKDGYAPWSKTLEVEETKVTEAKSVVLFPQSIQFNGKKFGLENIQPLSSEKIVLLHQPSDEAEKVSIYDLNREEEIGIASINALLASNDLTDVEVLDPQNLLFILKNNKSGKTGYYYVNLQSQSLAAQKLDFIGEGSDNFA